MKKEKISSRIWNEIPESDNPFAAATCTCYGYDVYGQMLGKSGWVEYLYLLFVGERPEPAQAGLLERIAVALANPGPRDHSVRASMNSAVGGAPAAAALIAALSVGAGELGGGREIVAAMQIWDGCGRSIDSWASGLKELEKSALSESGEIWKQFDHPPGFDPHGVCCTTPVLQVLEEFAASGCADHSRWLMLNRESLERAAGCPLAMSGVIAAGFADLGISADAAEMLYLILRLPGAAAHALEQKQYGWRKYPFFLEAVNLTDTPDDD